MTERYEEAKRLRDSGMTYKAVGLSLGVCATRAYRIIKDGDLRIETEKRRQAYRPWHDGLRGYVAMELDRVGIKSREDCMRLASNDLPVRGGSVTMPGWKLRGWPEDTLKLKIAVLNEVRSWLGVPAFVPKPRTASAKELERAIRLLERHGFSVIKPSPNCAARCHPLPYTDV